MRSGQNSELELFETELKWMGILWVEGCLGRLSCFHPDKGSARKSIVSFCGYLPPMSRTLSHLARQVTAYAVGKRISFSDVALDLKGTKFHNRVLLKCQAIPFGKVVTYGEMAVAVGSPGAARAVGTVMRTNPYPLVVPCHRVIGRGGRLTGYSAGSGVTLKAQLLEMEGIKQRFVF